MKNNSKYAQYTFTNQETRWATPEELKQSATRIDLNDTTYPAAGLPVFSDAKEAYIDGSDGHSLIFGATGSKKTRLFVMPTINIAIKAGESFIVTDPKGELYEKTAGLAAENGYKTVVLNFRDIGRGDKWNPLAIPYELYHSDEVDEATAMLNDFMAGLTTGPATRSIDPFWSNTSQTLGLGFLLMLMEYADLNEAHMASFLKFCQNDVVELMQENIEYFDQTSIGSINCRSTLTGSEKTTQNILVSLFSCVTTFAAQKSLCSMLSESTFDLRQIGREKTAVYLIVPDEKTTLHFLITTFIKQAYEILILEAQKEASLRLPIRVNFILDEFCNIPKIPDMPSMISAARSRNMRFFLVVQSKHQLKGKYGEDADTIKGNCDNWVFLTSRELDLLNEMSELAGSYRTPDGTLRRLISPSELQRLSKEQGEALIFHGRQYPIITRMPDIDDYTMFVSRKSPELPAFKYCEPLTFSPFMFISAVIHVQHDFDFLIFTNSMDDLRESLYRMKTNPRAPYKADTKNYCDYYGIHTEHDLNRKQSDSIAKVHLELDDIVNPAVIHDMRPPVTGKTDVTQSFTVEGPSTGLFAEDDDLFDNDLFESNPFGEENKDDNTTVSYVHHPLEDKSESMSKSVSTKLREDIVKELERRFEDLFGSLDDEEEDDEDTDEDDLFTQDDEDSAKREEELRKIQEELERKFDELFGRVDDEDETFCPVDPGLKRPCPPDSSENEEDSDDDWPF